MQKDTTSYSDNAKVMVHVKRHPFGLIMIYIGGGLGYLLIAAAIAVLVPEMLALKDSDVAMLLAGLGFFGVLVLLFMLVETVIYRQNELIVTENSVTQITQTGLFNRNTSRLDMENLEDVTSSQKGIIPSLFNYGTVLVETAGEQHNFKFYYCPKPTETAKLIHQCRQKFNEKVIIDQSDPNAHLPTATQPQAVPTYQKDSNPFDRPLQ